MTIIMEYNTLSNNCILYNHCTKESIVCNTLIIKVYNIYCPIRYRYYLQMKYTGHI